MQTFYQWLSQLDETPEDTLSRLIPHEDGVIGAFRQLVVERLGDLAVLVLDLRLAGGKTRSLVGSSAIGSPGRREVQRAVQGIRRLARKHAQSVDVLRIQRAMEREEETFRKSA
jgi:hypothetical protein